jgi:hypothetical protein
VLFKYRLDMLSDEERAQFMHGAGLRYELVAADEKTRLESKLCGLAGVTQQNLLKTPMYK